MAEANYAAAVHSELLLELSLLVNERKSVDEVFSSFAKRLLEVADFDYTTLLTGVPGTGYFEVVASYPFELPGAQAGVTVATRSFKYDDLIAAQEGYEYTARADSKTPASQELAAAGMSRVWVSALVSGGEVYGAFTMARARPEPYTEDERTFMLQASRLLAAAVRQETELANARRATARAQAANELALALNSGEHIESSFQRLSELVTTSIAADYVGLILDHGEGFVFVDEAPRGIHTGAPATEEGTRFIVEKLAQTNFMQARPAKGASPSDALFNAGFKRIGVAVLRDGETPVGLLLFGRFRSLKFNDEEQAFIELVRSMLSESITNARRLARSEAEAARSHTLNEVALLLNQGESVESIFARLLDVLAGALDIDYLGLLESGHEPGTFRMVGSRPVLMRDAGEIATEDDLRLGLLLQADGPVVQYSILDTQDASPFNRRALEVGMRRGASVIIREGAEVVGFLSLARKRASRFGPDEVAFIETLSAMLGQAIANERRLRRAQVAAARAAVLNQAALLMKQDEPAETMIAGLLPILRRAISFDYIALLEADFRGQELIMVAAEPRLGREPGDRLPLSASLVETMTRAARPVVQFRVEDVENAQPGLDSLREAGMKRGAAALLRQGEHIIGIFTLERRDPARLDDEELGFILTLANMLGQAIANRRRLEAAERQALRSRLLNEIAVQLDTGETIEELFGRLPEMLARVIDFDHLGLVTTLPDPQGLRLAAAHGDPGAPIGTVIPWPEREVERTLNRRPIVQFNPQETAGAGAEILAAAGYTRAVAAVIHESNRVFGSLQFARYQPVPFPREERDFIETLATLLSRAMGNQHHLEKVRAEAERTRLLNELAVLLHNGEGPERMFNRLTERLATVISFDALALLVSESPTRLRVADSLRRRSMRPGTIYHIDDLGNAPQHLSGTTLVWQAPIQEITGTIGRLTEAAGIRHAAIAVLRHNQAVAGYMFVARTDARPFTAEETSYIELLATMVAQAVANHRKVQESRAEAIRSQVLSELTVLLQEGDAFTEGFDHVSDVLLEAVGFDHISVTVRQPNGDGYHAIRSHELTLDGEAILFEPEGIDVLTSGGQMSRQYRTANVARAVPRALHQAGFARACTAVIVSDEGVEGLVTIGRIADLGFDDKEVTFIELVAALIGQASANYRKAWVKAQEAEEQAIIAEAASAVARELTALGIVAALRESVSRFIADPFCNFGYLADDGVLFSAPGRPEIRLPIGPGFRRALENGFDLVPPKASAGGSPESRVESERIGLQSHVITAAYSGGETVGLLIIGSRDPAFEPGLREVRLSRLIADIVGPAMANVRAVARQQQEAEDQRLLAQVAAVAAREAEPATLLAALHHPMRAIVPSPTIIFGFRDGENSIFPRLDGSYATVPLDPYARMLDEVGQIHSDELPEDLFAESELWGMGIHAISSTAVRAGGKTVGYLMVASRAEGYSFGERELRLFRLLAQIVGPAMENGRAAEKARDDAEEQGILAEAAASLAAAATEDQVIATLTPAVSPFVKGAVATVFFVEGDELVSPIGLGRDKYRPIAAEAMANGQVCVEKPWPELSPSGARMLEAGKIERFVNTSLNAGGTSTGILFVGTTDPGTRFEQRELRLISLIADMAGPALANARESRRRKDDAEEQRFLAEAAAVAASATSEVELVHGLARPFASLIPGSKLDLLYLLEDCVSSATKPDIRLPIGRGFLDAIANGQSSTFPDDPESSDEARARQAAMGITSGVSTRLSSRGETLGLFWLGTARVEPLTERDLRICRLVADVIGPALANLRESRRRKEDAEEQRFLAEAAAAAASAATQAQLVRRLARPFRTLIPGSRMDLFYLDGEILRSTVTGQPYSVGPHFRKALSSGQWLGEPYAAGGTPEADAGLAALGIVQAVSTRLSSGGKPLGVLWIGTTDQERLLSERDLRICRLVGDVVGPAFANLRESQRRQDDAEEQRFLAAVAGRAATATNEQELSAALREPFRQFTPGVLVNFFFREGNILRAADESTFAIGPQVERTLRDGQCVGSIEDKEVLPATRAHMRESGIVRWVLTAAVSEGEALGLLHVSTQDAERTFQERELRLYRLAADIVGPAMAHLRESRRRKEDAEEQRFLAAVAAAAATATTERELIKGLIGPFTALTPGALINFVFRDSDILRGPDGLVIRVGPQVEAAYRDGQSVGAIDDPEILEETRAMLRSFGVTRWVNTAASSEGESLGLLHVALRDPRRAFNGRELRLYRLASDIVGPAMAHLRENARRAREAEDERVLANVAALAAVTTTPDELIIALPGALQSVVPEAFVVCGTADDSSVTYRLSPPEARAIVNAEELTLPLTAVGRAARESGQGAGSLADIPPDRPYAALGLQAYSVTSYYSVGSSMGVIMVASRSPDYRFSEPDLALLRRVAQVVGPAIDASRAEMERARQAELYSLMLRSLSEGVILADKAGRPVFANELGRNVLHALNPAGDGVTWKTIVGMLPEEAREPYARVFTENRGGRGRSSLTIDGQLTYLDYEFVPLDDPQMKLLVVVTDVTADVLHEEEQQRSRERMEQAARLAALGELIGGVAHELNNPLTAVVGFAELMSGNPAAAELGEEIAVIQKEARRAADIVRDLLFIARPGTSERDRISVEELVGHIARIRRAHWAGVGIEPAIAIEPGCMVWGNEHQLTQVLLNLVSNAEHALAGQPQRRLTISGTCANGRTTLAVTDTGKGMDEATVARIWEPFFTTKPGVGTGLGLPLSYSIIQSHNGSVAVDSAPGQGTTFRVELPSGPDIEAPRSEQPQPDASAARVLVVDDEPSLRKVCQRLISSLGHYCDTAESSASALELARSRPYDLVLCDYRLSSETADHVMAGFSEVAPELIQRTVIATGATTDAGVVELIRRFNLELIAKPYGAEELSRIIAHALHERIPATEL